MISLTNAVTYQYTETSMDIQKGYNYLNRSIFQK